MKLAYEAQEAGGSATATLNAADEIAVEAFLAGEIPFPAIAATVAETLDRVPTREIHHRSRKCSKSIALSPGDRAGVIDAALGNGKSATEATFGVGYK